MDKISQCRQFETACQKKRAKQLKAYHQRDGDKPLLRGLDWTESHPVIVWASRSGKAVTEVTSVRGTDTFVRSGVVGGATNADVRSTRNAAHKFPTPDNGYSAQLDLFLSCSLNRQSKFLPSHGSLGLRPTRYDIRHNYAKNIYVSN